LFSLVTRALKDSGAPFGDTTLTKFLGSEWDLWRENSESWNKLILGAIQNIDNFYKKENVAYKKKEGKPLSFNKNFKSVTPISKIFAHHVPNNILKSAKIIVRRIKKTA
jgi:hypothetical protein